MSGIQVILDTTGNKFVVGSGTDQKFVYGAVLTVIGTMTEFTFQAFGPVDVLSVGYDFTEPTASPVAETDSPTISPTTLTDEPTTLAPTAPTSTPSDMPSISPTSMPTTSSPTPGPTTACSVAYCESITMRETSEYTFSSSVSIEAPATAAFSASTFLSSCDSSSTASTFYTDFTPAGSAIVITFPSPVTNPVLFIGVSDTQATTGAAILTFFDDVCVQGGATESDGVVTIDDSGNRFSLGITGGASQINGAVIAVIGTFDSITFQSERIVNALAVGWD
eukprot:CAMPEP_0118723424 /NCGR_PEP_ID=MMETSP0800-20121206/31995_1 /TAXON_ID=210618 ORGANISM="Striatella unipunctata, Strain CCMP2910" /NCGR_SAMPLE_ID=MMETSP0800 /ASSEMBLY_ACC=CAM_ASM_000638 /LENGTH=278 /DNA_ID=CAMNT_0006631847 /DNA_START=162 /DNA_END=998 /DNA_ORIENTATION=+